MDPTGQIEVRQIVLDMARKEGKTIFLSSHNLDEVQRICNRIALIDRGQIRLYGELDELQRNMGRGEVVVETAQPMPEAALAELAKRVVVVSRDYRTTILGLRKGGADTSDIVNLLAAQGVRIEQVRRREASLEEIYTTILKEAESH